MKVLLIVLGLIALVAGVVALEAWVLMFLFNMVAAYFGFKAISYTVSLCILGLLTLLPGGLAIGRK